MSPHVKKLIGTILTLVWLVIYCGLAIGVAVRVLPEAGPIARLLYYALAGTLWIVPVGFLLPWMYRDKR